MRIQEMTDSELRSRAISLDSSIRNLSRVAGAEDKIDELQADLDLIHEERERRHLNRNFKKE
jgi:hypothetical protein